MPARKAKKKVRRVPNGKAIRHAAFLAALSEFPNVTAACRKGHVSRSKVYERRATDPEFAKAWDEALDRGMCRAEDDVADRAFRGLPKLKFHEGQVVMAPKLDENDNPVLDEKGEWIMVPYVEREYSDALAQFILKAHRPDKYRERREVEHSGGVTVQIVKGLADE